MKLESNVMLQMPEWELQLEPWLTGSILGWITRFGFRQNAKIYIKIHTKDFKQITESPENLETLIEVNKI